MVTVEPSADYYADLELDPQATIADVKKQYRKLALKYHPDRNLGQEVDSSAKFQAIQAASEVLSDPALRAKYDAQRIRDPPLRRPPDRPPRPNVRPRTRTTTADFPPPPRPPPPNSYKSSHSPPPNATGSRKYAVPPRSSGHWGHYNTDEVKAKANDFKAWEQMRHGHGPTPKARPAPQRAPRPSAFDPERTSPPRKEPETMSTKAREKWEDLLDAGMSKLGRHPRRSAHGRDSLDDDDIDSRPTAYNVFKGEYPRKPEPPPLPKRDINRGDPLPSAMRDPLPPRGDRNGINYPPFGSERVGSGANLHRANTSATARDTTGRPFRYTTDSVRFENDHIRASSAGATDHQRTPGSTTLSSETTSETSTEGSSDEAERGYFAEIPSTNPRRSKSRKQTHSQIPTDGNTFLKTGFSPHIRVDEGQAPNSHYAGPRRHSGIDLSAGTAFGEYSLPLNPNRMSHGANLAGPTPTNPTAAASPGPRVHHRHRSFDGRFHSPTGNGGPAPPSQETNQTGSGYSPLSTFEVNGPLPFDSWSQSSVPGPLKKTSLYHHGITPYWAFPSSIAPPKRKVQPVPSHVQYDLYQNSNFLSRSSANQSINSYRFANNEPRQQRPAPPPRSQSSETINTKFSNSESPPKFGSSNPFASRRPPYSNGDVPVPPEAPTSTTQADNLSDSLSPTADLPPPPKVGDKWSPEEWEKRFGVHTFEIPISNPPSSRATSRKRSGTPKASLHNLRRAGTFKAAPFQPSVLDDDNDAVSNSQAEPDPDNVGKVRREQGSNVSDGMAMDIDSTPPAAHNRELEEGFAPPNAGGSIAFMPAKANGTSFRDTRATGFNLNGFRHVAPFSTAQGGLGEVNDLKDALPFESKPSAAKPDFAKCYEKVDLPNPPKPPPPPGGIDDMSFAQYVSAMNVYMFNWNSFNTKMILMFQRRQEEHREIGQGWIGQVGGDVGAYLNALDEDERARLWWTTACEKHKITMQNLKTVRDAILRSKGSV